MNMKGTTNFKATIQVYLEERARTDELFAVSYAKEHKNIDNCITYILNEVKVADATDSTMMKSIRWQCTTMMRIISL